MVPRTLHPGRLLAAPVVTLSLAVSVALALARVSVCAQPPESDAAPSLLERSVADTVEESPATPPKQPPSAPPNAANRARTPARTPVEDERDLPNDQGQVLRKYDISRYTDRVTSTNKPEQAIVDWILRETGTEVWFGEPLGFLSAGKQTLRVYHTPEMHQIVSDVIDRFVNSRADAYVVGVRMATITNPNWRAKALPLLKPVDSQSAGVEAWLVSKENATILYGSLRKRTDFREHIAKDLVLENGQSFTFSRTTPQTFIHNVRLGANAFPGYELVPDRIDTGYSLQISPLFAVDEQTVDTVLKCNIDQIEKLLPVVFDLPAAAAQQQRVQIQVPQMVSWRLHERFRWPTDQVLVLSCGVVATPTADRPTTLGIPNPFSNSPGRADGLLMIECKGRSADALLAPERTASIGTTVR